MVLNENDFYNIIFQTIQQKPGDEIAMILMKNTCDEISKKNKGFSDEDEIYEEVYNDVLSCFNYYNAFVEEKKMPLPIISDWYYSMVDIILKGLKGDVINEKESD